MRTRFGYVCLSVAAASALLGAAYSEDNFIIQWNTNIPPEKYSINQFARSVTINQGDSGLFKFEAIDLSTPYPHEPGDINSIDSGAVGEVQIMIHGNPSYGRTYGARHVKAIDLSNCHPGKLDLTTISGDLGQVDGVFIVGFENHVSVGGDILGMISASSCVGNFTIGGDVRSTIMIYTLSGKLTVYEDLIGPLRVRTLDGVTVNGLGPHTGEIRVERAYPGQMTIAGEYAGNMSFWQGVSGQSTIGSDLTGSIGVTGNLTGSVTVQDDVNAVGRISVGGDMGGSVKVEDQLAGQVRINGSLLNGAAENDVWIGTAIDTTGAVAVDYNGWQDGDDWAAGAVVRVGANTYTQSTATARVYEITPCRADLDNDGGVNFGDINPFVLALTNPVEFATAYPGLDGSMVFHGDLTCDETLDFADINPFVVRLIEGCCREQCGPCPPPGNAPPPAMPEPGELAALLAANIDPELYDDLVALAAAVAAYDSDPEVAAYRQDVYEALT